MDEPVVPPSPVPAARFAPDNVKAISWILFSVTASSAMTIAVRQSSLEIDTRMVVFLRFTMATILLAAFYIWSRGPVGHLKFSRPVLHLVRGVLMAVSTHLGFYSVANLELVTATVLFFCAPIFATIFAGWIHGERAGPRRRVAVVIGFLGVLVVLRPGVDALDPVMLSALGSAILFGLALVLSRPLAVTDGSFSTLFSTTVVTAIFTIPLAIPVWQLPTEPVTWIAIVAIVVTGISRMIGDLQAYRYGEAASLAPISYLRLILIGAAAYFIYCEVPDGTALVGAAVIVGAAIYIARREAILKKRSLTEG